MRKLVLLLLLCVSSLSTMGQMIIEGTTITVDDGVPHNLVYDVFVDDYNQVWLATYDGIASFDGTTFRTFRPGTSYLANQVRKFELLKGDSIMVYTFDGCFIFDIAAEKFTPIEMPPELVDTKWYRADRTYSNRFKIDTDHMLHYPATTSRPAGEIDLSGVLNAGRPAIQPIDNSTDLLIMCAEELFFFDMDHLSLSAIKGWVGREFNRAYEDRTGTIWVGNDRALFKFKPTVYQFENYLAVSEGANPPVPMKVSMRELCEGANGIIYARENGGNIYAFDPATDELMDLDFACKMKMGERHTMFIDTNQILWAEGTSEDIVKYNTANHSCTFIASPFEGLKNIFVDFRGRMWYVTQNRLYRDLNLNSSIPYPYDSEYVSMSADGKELFIPLTHGIAIYNCQYDTMAIYNELFDASTEVRQVIRLGEAYWLGTHQGLVKWSPGRAPLVFDMSNKLPGQIVYSILPVDSLLCVGTDRGLSLFNPYTYEATNYYVGHGMANYEFNSKSILQASDGRIYMGGMNGIDAFYVEDLIQKSTKPATLRLMEVHVRDRRESHSFQRTLLGRPGLKDIVLSHSNRQLTIEFAMDNYPDHGVNQYAFFMDGLEEDWMETGSTASATYYLLPPGDYVFRVKGLDPDGNWSENELSIPVTVRQVWYKTWLALALYTLGLFILSVLIYKGVLRRKLQAQENKRLVELDEVKTGLYTRITHEFRTPLTVILGVADRLTPAEENANILHRNANKLLTLVNQMLDLSKVNSGMYRVKSIQSDVLTYLNYIVESFYSLAEDKKVRLVFFSKLNELVIDYDPELLETIVSNLVSNALKFTPSGGKVVVHADSGDMEGNRCFMLTVSDSGPGMSLEAQQHIFEPFYQGHDKEVAQSPTGSGGTGIGLTLTKEVVDLMGGHIGVESELGKGSKFIVRFPITNQATLQSPNQTPVYSPLAASMTQEDRRVFDDNPDMNLDDHPLLLIIEDNVDVANYIASCLEDEFSILAAPNGAVGLEMACSHIPDIVISDVMMPLMDGFEVTKKLKEDIRTSHIPVILLTAKADERSRLAGYSTGADAYLSKPFNATELRVRMTHMIDLRKKLQDRYSQEEEAVPSSDRESEFLSTITDLVDEHMDDTDFGVVELSAALAMSQSQLYRKVRALTGRSTTAQIRHCRLKKACELLKAGKMNISEVAYSVGFAQPSSFTRAFTQAFGVAPNKWKG